MAVGQSRKKTISCALSLLVCLFWYGLLAGEVSWTEFAAGLPAAVAAMIYIELGRGDPVPALRLAVPGRAVCSALKSLIVDSGRVGARLARSLLQPAAGAILHQPFDAGAATAEDAGRRAAVTLLISLAPNGFVLDLPPAGGSDDLLLHQLVRRPPASDTEGLA